MGVAQSMKWGVVAIVLAVCTLAFVGPAVAKSDCDQTVCAMTTAEARTIPKNSA